ncbi:MAG: hypothetical protein R3E95_04180 [Thiolinea sp.]
MIDTSTTSINTSTPQRSDCDNSVQTDKSRGVPDFNTRSYEPASGRNPGHDGCRLSGEQLEQTKQTAQANSSERGNSSSKASGGACPGGNLITQLLQDLAMALNAAPGQNKD